MKPPVCLLALTILVSMHAASGSPKDTDLVRFEKLASEGDARAMTELGLRYHEGRGVKQDHALAYDWYMKAVEKGDGDALNNLGVLHRDGLGVPKNQKVAYLIFLAVHMEGMGDDDTQIRAGRNLQRLVDQLPKTDIYEALSYTWPYVVQILKSRGKDLSIGPDVLPSKERPRIRDNGWWLDGERKGMTFESPSPWNEKKGKPAARTNVMSVTFDKNLMKRLVLVCSVMLMSGCALFATPSEREARKLEDGKAQQERQQAIDARAAAHEKEGMSSRDARALAETEYRAGANR